MDGAAEVFETTPAVNAAGAGAEAEPKVKVLTCMYPGACFGEMALVADGGELAGQVRRQLAPDAAGCDFPNSTSLIRQVRLEEQRRFGRSWRGDTCPPTEP